MDEIDDLNLVTGLPVDDEVAAHLNVPQTRGLGQSLKQ